MHPSDKETRLKALTRLAIATREKVEPQTFAVYLDDTQSIATSVLAEACHRLEKSATWFPKVAEVLEACSTVVKERKLREEWSRPRLNPPADEPSPERKMQWLQTLREICTRRAMPSVDVSDDRTDGRTLRRVK